MNLLVVRVGVSTSGLVVVVSLGAGTARVIVGLGDKLFVLGLARLGDFLGLGLAFVDVLVVQLHGQGEHCGGTLRLAGSALRSACDLLEAAGFGARLDLLDLRAKLVLTLTGFLELTLEFLDLRAGLLLDGKLLTCSGQFAAEVLRVGTELVAFAGGGIQLLGDVLVAGFLCRLRGKLVDLRAETIDLALELVILVLELFALGLGLLNLLVEPVGLLGELVVLMLELLGKSGGLLALTLELIVLHSECAVVLFSLVQLLGRGLRGLIRSRGIARRSRNSLEIGVFLLQGLDLVIQLGNLGVEIRHILAKRLRGRAVLHRLLAESFDRLGYLVKEVIDFVDVIAFLEAYRLEGMLPNILWRQKSHKSPPRFE